MTELRPAGYPKTDGYPKEIPRKLWDRRESIMRALAQHPLGEEITIEKMLKSIKEMYFIDATDPELRKTLKALLDLGYPVGSNDKGYYYGVYRGDMQPTKEQLVSRRQKIDDRIMTIDQIDRNLPERPQEAQPRFI